LNVIELVFVVTPIFDRRNPIPTPKMQIGFMVGLVQPLYLAFAKIPGINLEEPLRHINENMVHWQEEISKLSAPKVYLYVYARLIFNV
jgi:hypothetical protein